MKEHEPQFSMQPIKLIMQMSQGMHVRNLHHTTLTNKYKIVFATEEMTLGAIMGMNRTSTDRTHASEVRGQQSGEVWFSFFSFLRRQTLY